jgi:glycosyltransferase involved in cell wall biosynthesis
VDSIVSQRDVDLEYIVVDGASTDGTAEYLRSRAHEFARFESASDDGQYHGIAKGLRQTSGEIMGWLNGDDVLLPWTLRLVQRIFAQHPEIQWITGMPAFMNDRSECFLVNPVAASYPRQYIANGWYREGLLGYLMQEAMFWRRSLWEQAGGLDLRYSLAADFALWRQFARHAELTAVATPLSAFRIRGVENRSRQGTHYRDEVDRCCASAPRPPAWWRALARLGKPGQAILRMLLWAKTPVIAHSLEDRDWQLVRCWRPVSRADIPRLMLERHLRRRSAVQA